jgi:hypothetical protein
VEYNILIFEVLAIFFLGFWLGWGFARLSFWYYANKKHINHPFLEANGYTLNKKPQE